ncbi:helix-turn-helix domain-containing protein [Roseobacter weihaiensis]|uniref:helix-turn-helix domain-containing protein n=1 Tax=Roseobacter weihaiensis TaxID=2763262 RepID=UPI001D0A730C|nr:helix-turn-helix domain-containing protein [Roseobacter sp. H9]
MSDLTTATSVLALSVSAITPTVLRTPETGTGTAQHAIEEPSKPLRRAGRRPTTSKRRAAEPQQPQAPPTGARTTVFTSLYYDPTTDQLGEAIERDQGYWHEPLTSQQAAEWLGVTAESLRAMRSTGAGPKFHTAGSRKREGRDIAIIRYTRADILEWLMGGTPSAKRNRSRLVREARA